MAITLNEITKYIKHNHSDINFDLNVVSNFEQPMTIPDKVVNPDKQLTLEADKTLDTNVLKYRKDEIINLPNFLSKFFDLNNYYTFGVNFEKSFIYSLLYCVDTNFKFLSESEQESFITDLKMTLLESVKNVKKGKTEITKCINSEDYSNLKTITFMETHFSRNIIILDLNEKKSTTFNEFNPEFNTIVVLKSGDTYFPLSCIDGSDISNATATAIVKFFK